MRHYQNPRLLALITCWVLAGVLAACTSEQVIHANAPPATSAEQAPVEQRLLDVGIEVFDPGLPEKKKSNPKLRKLP